MKNKIIFFLFLLTTQCYSQQIVKLEENINLYNENYEVIKLLDKNTKLKVSKYEFEYHINDNYEYDYYADLEDDYAGFKVQATKLVPENSEDVFDAALITKPGEVYFIDEFFQGLSLHDINIIYKCYENTIKKTENSNDYRDWKECCSFYQKCTYITNSQISFQNYFSTFFGEIKNIKKENDMYKLDLSYYFYFDYNQNKKVNNKDLQKEGEDTFIYLKEDGDYISLYCSDKKTLINTFIRTKKQTQIEFENFLKTKSYVDSNVTWPRHADGTCDYDGSKKTAAVQTAKATPSTNVAPNKTMTVSENLKLRSGEATTSEVLTVMSAGTKVKITGTNTYIDVELDDRTARIAGEMIVGGFVCYKSSMKNWLVPENEPLTEEDKKKIIQKVTEKTAGSHMVITFE